MSNHIEPMQGAKDLPEYQQGYKAREKGKPRVNPYTLGIREDAWWLGWDDCDDVSRATRDAAEGHDDLPQPEGFVPYPPDYADEHAANEAALFQE